RGLTAKVGIEFADAVLLPQNDPTEAAENTRQQMFENGLLMTGQSVPVSPRDNHVVHLDVLHEAAAAAAQAALDDPSALAALDAFGAHGMAHLVAAEQAGLAEQVRPYREWLSKLGNTIQQLQALDAEAAQVEAAPAEAP